MYRATLGNIVHTFDDLATCAEHDQPARVFDPEVIRAKVNGAFKDVNLDCLGVVGGWQPVGEYEWARVDLITGNFQGVGNCSTGRHEIKSDGRFGLWVWGWGTPLTSFFTENVSYGYPGGMNVQPINQIVIPSTPK